MASGHLFNFLADILHIRTWRDEDCQIRWHWIGQVAEHGVAIHKNVATFAGVVVIRIHYFECRGFFSQRQLQVISSFDFVFVGEWFADDNVVLASQLSENLLSGASGEKIGTAVGARSAEINRCQSRRHAVITDFVGAKALDRGDSWQLRNFLHKIQREAGMAVRRRAARGPHVEVCGQLIIHPRHDRLAETPNHYADRNHHGDSRGEGANQHGSSAQCSGQTASRQQGFNSHQFF